MAYDEALAERIREVLSGSPEIAERKMFGGIAFMSNGNMAIGISNDELMVRVGVDAHGDAMARPGVRIFDLSGKPMKGWVLVSPDVIVEDDGLEEWIEIGLDFAATLPPK